MGKANNRVFSLSLDIKWTLFMHFSLLSTPLFLPCVSVGPQARRFRVFRVGGYWLLRAQMRQNELIDDDHEFIIVSSTERSRPVC